jgi:hypothetical protein
MCLCSLSSDLLSDGLGARSCDDLDPIWSHDLPTVMWSGTSGVTTSVCDKDQAKYVKALEVRALTLALAFLRQEQATMVHHILLIMAI